MTQIALQFVDPVIESNRERTMQDLAARLGISPVRLELYANGKPHLITVEGKMFGCSISYARSNNHKAGIFAVSDHREIGVDLERWPHQAADPAFIASVAALKDGAVIDALGDNGRDAGVALWVIKEAALKCSGDVMFDPRLLTVKLTKNGLFLVSASENARMPLPEIEVSLHVSECADDNRDSLLLGLALPRSNVRDRRVLIFSNDAGFTPYLSQKSDN